MPERCLPGRPDAPGIPAGQSPAPRGIEKVFPDAIVLGNVGSDYRYRAFLPRSQVALALVERLEAIGYGNFKNSVRDADLHDAYYQIWGTMVRYQEREPCTP